MKRFKIVVNELFVITISIILLINSCKEKTTSIKDRESIINSLAYPIEEDEVVRIIGLPDSITYEKYDAVSFGTRINNIYHYGKYELIFSPHKVYMGNRIK